MARKPTGVTGPVRISVGSNGPQIEHLKIQWPTDQKGIERKILEYHLRALKDAGVSVLAVKDGGTEELDFLLEFPGGKEYMELMEAVVPAGRVPFQPGHGKYVAGQYADRVFAEVRKKIAKYGMRHEVPICLMIYTTHEQYSPSDAAFWALARRFADTEHPFEFVWFVVPFTDDDARIQLLYSKFAARDFPPTETFESQEWITLVGGEAKLFTSSE